MRLVPTTITTITTITLLAIAVVPLCADETSDPKSKSIPSVETREDLLLFTSLLNKAATKFHQSVASRIRSQTCAKCHDMGTMQWLGGFSNGSGDLEFAAQASGMGPAHNPHKELSAPKVDIKFTSAYLPGVGVVVQGFMPEPALQYEAKVEERGKEKLDEWELARRALRGIPEEEEKYQTINIISKPTHPELAAQLTEVIRKNAKRIRGLQPDDQISVAITFTPNAQPAAFAGVAMLNLNAHGDMGSLYPLEGYDEADMYEGGESGYGPGVPGGEGDSGGYGEAFEEYGEDYGAGEYGGGFGEGAGYGEMMGMGMSALSQGDLHLRRGDYAKAAGAFTQEIESRLKIKVKDIASTSLEKLAPVEPQLKKLSQARIANGEFEQAKELLEIIQKVSALKVKSEQTFLRRLFIDMLGRMPTAEESKAYLASKAPNRRQKLIEQLATQQKVQEENALKGRLPAQLIVSGKVSDWASADAEDAVSVQFIFAHTLGDDEEPRPWRALPRDFEGYLLPDAGGGTPAE